MCLKKLELTLWEIVFKYTHKPYASGLALENALIR